MSIYNRQDLEKLIFEEIDKMAATKEQKPILKEVEETPEPDADPTQQYVDWIVAIQESAREALQEIEGGTEPYKAAIDSRLAQLAFGLTDEDFYHHFHG